MKQKITWEIKYEQRTIDEPTKPAATFHTREKRLKENEIRCNNSKNNKK